VVKIIDFGLAKAFHSATDPKSLTHDRFVGTPAFASPEQFEHSALDVRSDIYSLGETLWFALTGKTPFAGRTLSEIHRAQKSNTLPTEQLKAAHVPHGLKSLIESMLALQPASRPGTAALAARLKRCTPEVRSVRRTRAALVVAAVVVCGLSIPPIVHQCQVEPPASEKSIAVLPFENLSKDEENAFFAGGVQDEILTDLARISDLKVISRTSVMKYMSGPERNLREIAKTLHVSHVVEGSVQRAGGRIRVSAQLIDALTDNHLWADHYDRDFADIFAIQSEIAQQIADQLRIKFSPAEKARLQQKPTTSGEAYVIYLQAQNSWVGSQSREDLEKAAQLYQKAIELDPSFALALARLSCVESTLYQGTANHSSLEKARATANEAIRLQPGLPETHLALGYLLYRGYRDYERALRELAVAKAGLPNDADILLVTGSIERRQGNWSQSTSDLEKAASLNPKDGSLWANLASNYQALRNFPAAARAFDRGATEDPNFLMNRYLRARLDIDWKGDTSRMEKLLAQTPEGLDADGKITLAEYQLKLLQRKYHEAILTITGSPHFDFQGWNTLRFPKRFLVAQAYSLAHHEVEARVSFEEAQHIMEQRLLENPLDASHHALLGQILASLGRTDDAIREGQRAVELLPEAKDALDGPIMTLALAHIYTMVGDFASATPLLEHSLTTPGGITVPLLKLDPVWDPLRGNPSFEKMIALFGGLK
jgi:TolB-like protein/Flp pilus assembly protein TadD